MELRSLLNKLDNLHEQQFMTELESLMEKVGLRLADLTAAVRGITNDDERAAKIGEFARQYNFPGLFDPMSGKFVNADGKFAWFGGYESEVRQLAAKGLIPDAAKTTAVLGLMGQDEKVAKPTSQAAERLYLQIDKADELIKKAIEMPVSEGIAVSLLKEFGINTNLLEAITPEEHQLINKTRKDIEPLLKSGDGDAIEYKANYDNYIRMRNELIARIKALIEEIKKQPAPSQRAGQSTTTNESNLHESKQLLVELELTDKGRRAGAKIFEPSLTGYLSPQQSQHNLNMLQKGYARYTAGDHIGQNIRDIFNAPTLGGMDKLQAYLSSRGDRNTSYEKELAKLRGQTQAYNQSSQAGNLRNAVKAVTGYEISKENPFGNITPGDLIGSLGGGIGLYNAGAKLATKIGLPKLAGGLTTSLAAPVAIAHATEPENGQRVNPQPGGRKDPKIKAFQDEVLLTDKKAFPKHGADGIMGPEVRAAIEKYPDLAKKHGLLAATTTTGPNQAPAAADSQTSTASAGNLSQADQVYQGADTTPTTSFQSDQNLLIDPNSVQTMVAQISNTPELSPDQVLALADKLKIDAAVAESEDLSRMLKLSGLNEVAGVVPSIFGAVERNVIRYGGEIWRRTGNTWKSASGKTKPAEKMDRLLAKKEFKPSPGGTPMGRVDSVKNVASMRANAAVDSMVRDAIKKRAIASADDIASKLPEAAKTGFRGFLSTLAGLGGKFVQLLKNPKFLALLAVLAALGYFIGTRTNRNDPNGPNGPAVTPQPGPAPTTTDAEEKKREEERRRKLGELNELLKRLYGGWPTDAETAAAIQAGVAVGGSAPQGFNPAGNSQQVSTQPGNAGYVSPINADTQREIARAERDGVLPPGSAEKKTQ